MPTPSARTVKFYRDQGFLCATVEKWIPMIKRRVDLFGCFDQIMVKPGEVWGIQTTTNSNVSSHVEKLLAIPEFHKWLQYGCHAAIVAWAVRGKRRERKKWTAKELIYCFSTGTFHPKGECDVEDKEFQRDTI